MEGSLPKTLGTLIWYGKPLMWADHLTIASSCACIAEHDLAEAAARMGAALLLLQRDLVLECLRVDLVQEVVQSASQSALLHLVLHYRG